MQNLQNLKTTTLDPNLQSQEELYRFTEQLSSGLPGLHGNDLMLLKIGVPTPSGHIVFPEVLRKRISVQFYLDVAPGKRFIRHVRPDEATEKRSGDPHSDAGGPVYRLWVSRLPIPQKHEVISCLGF